MQTRTVKHDPWQYKAAVQDPRKRLGQQSGSKRDDAKSEPEVAPVQADLEYFGNEPHEFSPLGSYMRLPLLHASAGPPLG